MSWEAEYRQKLISPEEAAHLVKLGDRIVVGSVNSPPQRFMQALVKRAPELEGVEIVHMRVLAATDYVKPGMERHLRLNAFYFGPTTRQAFREGRADFTTATYFGVSSLFRDNYLPVDMVVLHLSPPDNGYFSYGSYIGYLTAATECARLVVAEVNDKMPWTYGQDPLHISKLDHIIEVSYPIPELPAEPVLDVHKKIGRYVADLVEDGSTLQIGVGAVPDVILSFLSGRKELGVHTEILTNNIVPLIEQGVITNQHKRLNQGKSVATMLDGSQRLFQFAHKNPLIEIYPIEYTNDPYIISQNDKVVAINSALEIDLTGQVNCETIDGQLYGGVGGVLDFGLGANRSSGGKNILAFPSTAKGGQVSRVVPTLKPGTVVSIPRTQVDYVVTEHGVSQLKAKTLRQRAKLLIDLAAPAFRDELWNQARSLKLT